MPVASRFHKLQINREICAFYLALRDPRVPFYARLLMAGVIAYALSPVDLIPDFIPVIGYLDDVILLPLGIRLVLRMIPPDIMDEHRQRAGTGPRNTAFALAGAAVIIIGWLAALGAVVWVIARMLLGRQTPSLGISRMAAEKGTQCGSETLR